MGDRSPVNRPSVLVPLALGMAALVGGTLLGWNPALVEAVVRPPTIVRAALVGGSVAIGLALLAAAVRRMEGTGGIGLREITTTELAVMIRAIRLVFLAVAAFAGAAGWALAHPLPIVVALVIAGVDVVETSLLLLVVTLRSARDS